MKHIKILLLLVASIALSSPVFSQKPDVAINKAVKGFEAALEKGLSHDLSAVLTPGFTLTLVDGSTLSRSEFLSNVFLLRQVVAKPNMSLSTKSVKTMDGKAVANIESNLTGTLVSSDGKRMAVSVYEAMVTTWLKTKSGWKLASARQTAMHQKIDGKTVALLRI